MFLSIVPVATVHSASEIPPLNRRCGLSRGGEGRPASRGKVFSPGAARLQWTGECLRGRRAKAEVEVGNS